MSEESILEKRIDELYEIFSDRASFQSAAERARWDYYNDLHGKIDALVDYLGLQAKPKDGMKWEIIRKESEA